jgi:hypothetical protein
MKQLSFRGAVFAAGLLAIFVTIDGRSAPSEPRDDVVGAWRAKVQGSAGMLAAMKDLEFMYAFNLGGTMTESSNYDAAPPAPPAYGIWRKVGARQYEAKYEFFWTKAPASFDEIAKGGGWPPGGHGVLLQKITLRADGNTFDSTIRLDLFDQQGQSVDGGGEGTGQGARIRF